MELNFKDEPQDNTKDLNYRACGHYLIIELDEVPDENVTNSGIIIAAGSKERGREQAGMSLAKVLNVGPNCWAGFTNSDGECQPWCWAGDKVMLAQYAGQAFPVNDAMEKPEQEYFKRLRLIKDDDVLALVGIFDDTPEQSVGGNR